jgi:hypothetical protein
MAIAAARHAQRLTTLGSAMAGCLGAYSLALALGAYRVHHHLSRSSTTTDGSCAVGGASVLHTLRQTFLAPAHPPTPSKTSLASFPALCLACAALLIWRSRPRVPIQARSGQAAVDTATLARLLVEGKALSERANLGRLLSNVVAVLFLWRMSSLYGQRQRQQQQQQQQGKGDQGDQDDDDPAARLVRLWFAHCVVMAGVGLALGLLNLMLYAKIQTQLRNLRHAVRHRVRAPATGVAAGL